MSEELQSAAHLGHLLHHLSHMSHVGLHHHHLSHHLLLTRLEEATEALLHHIRSEAWLESSSYQQESASEVQVNGLVGEPTIHWPRTHALSWTSHIPPSHTSDR